MTRTSPVMARIFKEEGKLEIWKQKTNGRYDLIAELRHLQMVGQARAEVHRGRPPGAGRLLYGAPGADEPQLELSPGLQHRLSQRLRPRQWPHRRQSDGAWRLLVVGLLFDDRRADRADLRLRPRRLPRRPDRIPDPGLSVPHDRRQHGALPQRPELRVLEDAQGRLRLFRDHQGAARRSMSARSATSSTRLPRRARASTRRAPARHHDAARFAADGLSKLSVDLRGGLSSAVQGRQTPAPKPTIGGTKEAAIVSDWTQARARGERVPIEPPSLDAGRQRDRDRPHGPHQLAAGRSMAALEAEQGRQGEGRREQKAAAEAAGGGREGRSCRSGRKPPSKPPARPPAEAVASRRWRRLRRAAGRGCARAQAC